MCENKKHLRNFKLKFIYHCYLNFSGQILKKVNSVDLGKIESVKKRFFNRFAFLKFNPKRRIEFL